MELLDMLSVVLPNANSGELGLYIYIAKEDAKRITKTIELPETLNPTLMQMILELYNRRGTEGLKSQNISGVGGISETYLDDYSPYVYTMLSKATSKRIKVM